MLTPLQLQHAYSVVSDAAERRKYDELYRSRQTSRSSQKPGRTSSPHQDTHPPSQPSETSQPVDTEEIRGYKRRLIELRKRIHELLQQKSSLEQAISDTRERLSIKQSMLDNLGAEARKDADVQTARTGRGEFFLGFLRTEKLDEYSRRETSRMTGRIVIEAQFEQYKTKLHKLVSLVADLSTKLQLANFEQCTTTTLKDQAEQRIRDEERRKQNEMKEEARKREELRKKQAEIERLRQAQAEANRRFQEATQEAQQRAEEAIQAQQRAAEAAAEARRQAQEVQRGRSRRRSNRRRGRNTRGAPRTQNPPPQGEYWCQHSTW